MAVIYLINSLYHLGQDYLRELLVCQRPEGN